MMYIVFKKTRSALLLSALMLCSPAALAQDQSQQTVAQVEVSEKESLVAIDPRDDKNINIETMPSLLFNAFEEQLIREAIRDSNKPKAPPSTSPTGVSVPSEPEEPKPPPPPEARYITLSGITFQSADDWTIWLNGQRVTPKAIPDEILTLDVAKDYVDMKWFDEYTNKIFPIRLRPHQRFHIDMRIFLPG